MSLSLGPCQINPARYECESTVGAGLMFEIDKYWARRLQGANRPASSQLEGWNENPSTIDGFVEPQLTLLEGDPETAKILIVAAPGAVGKSSFARELGHFVNFAMVDLAQTSPLGGNFFKGGLANAFGLDALSEAAAGKIGVIVDALDEAQLRAGPQGYEAGLLDLASVTAVSAALPAVMFGRSLAAEEAYLLISAAGHSACLFQIEFFDEERSGRYLSAKLPAIAALKADVRAAYETHRVAFDRLAVEARARLTAVKGGDEPQFGGYAPVLDAICEFTLDPDELNPQARLAKLGSSSQIELIRDISTSILEREQKKLSKQFLEKHSECPPREASILYDPEEQLCRVAAVLFGSQPPPPLSLSDPGLQATYVDMVAQFAPQHPFLSGASGAANSVFGAYVMAWALTDGDMAEVARRASRAQPSLISGMLFELYSKWLSDDAKRVLPLADVGILYHALSSQVTTGQRVALEIDGEGDSGAVSVQFEILERPDSSTGVTPQGLLWGPFQSSNDTALELRSPFSNVFIDAAIWVELGDGIVQQIGAPTEITVEQLTISARQVLVQPAVGDSAPERHTVSLLAVDADCQSVQAVTVRDSALAVSWPGARVYPWTNFVVEAPVVEPEIDFMRRRLRKVLTAFRSHSKGSLVRLAAKIDHSRMTKDARGVALVRRLLADRVLSTFEAGKFYVLDPDRMGHLLGVDYQGLHQQRFTAQSDAYLASVLTEI